MNFGSALEQVHRRAPLVDCITNFVTVNDCANILLAVGGSPTRPRTSGKCRRPLPPPALCCAIWAPSTKWSP